MKIEFFNSGSADFPWWVLIAWGAVWLCVLYGVLTRSDFDTLAKLLWTIVVIFVPVFGVFLYWLAAPPPPNMPSRKFKPGSDVSGTPWADDPNYSRDK